MAILFLPKNTDRYGEGGLRTQGEFKKSLENKPLFTVITVVYNGELYLEDTIKSVINQTYDNIEYIIIDGGSTDRTLDIIKKYEDQIDYWVSEKDAGIYAAMNKGIPLVTGKWINFMNAGDSFSDESVLIDITKDLKDEDKIIYGDVVVQYDKEHTKLVKPNNLSLFYQGMPFCHQSCFIDSDLMKSRRYDLTYKICADFHFFYSVYNADEKFKYVHRTIALYDYNGISTDSPLSYIEQKKIVLSFSEKYKFYYSYIYYKNILNKHIKSLLPLKIIRKLQMVKNGTKVTK